MIRTLLPEPFLEICSSQEATIRQPDKPCGELLELPISGFLRRADEVPRDVIHNLLVNGHFQPTGWQSLVFQPLVFPRVVLARHMHVHSTSSLVSIGNVADEYYTNT